MHPERASVDSFAVDAEVHLTYSGLSTLYEEAGDGGSSTEGDYEQLVSGIGFVRIGGDRWEVDGLGIRAHRWEPRPAQAVRFQRRVTANIGPSFGFMGFHVAAGNGPGRRGGFVWDGTALHVCNRLTIRTSWGGGDTVPRSIDLTLRAGDQAWHATGNVFSLLARPVDGFALDSSAPTMRVCEGLTEWRLADGQIGYGMSEYVDQIVDGRPAGLAE
jgi:hypothetical protein